MKKAGYQLEYSPEVPVEDVVLTCEEALLNSSWEKQSGSYLNRIYVKNDTPLIRDDFSEEDYEEGSTLFQILCFRLAQAHPALSFQGTCSYADEDKTIRIGVRYSGDEMIFRIRKTTRDRQQFHTLNWYRNSTGVFEKGAATYRERDRQ